MLSPLTALAAVQYTDPTEYGYSETFYDRLQVIGNKFGAACVVTTDNQQYLYTFNWSYAETAKYIGEYDGHRYFAFMVRNTGESSFWRASLTTDWEKLAGQFVAICGDYYIAEHFNDVIADADTHVHGNGYGKPYLYAGSCLMGYANIPSWMLDEFPYPSSINYFDFIGEIASTFLSSYVKPFIDIIVAEPILFVICLFGVVVSIVTFVYSFVRITSSKKVSKPKRRKRG